MYITSGRNTLPTVTEVMPTLPPLSQTYAPNAPKEDLVGTHYTLATMPGWDVSEWYREHFQRFSDLPLFSCSHRPFGGFQRYGQPPGAVQVNTLAPFTGDTARATAQGKVVNKASAQSGSKHSNTEQMHHWPGVPKVSETSNTVPMISAIVSFPGHGHTVTDGATTSISHKFNTGNEHGFPTSSTAAATEEIEQHGKATSAQQHRSPVSGKYAPGPKIGSDHTSSTPKHSRGAAQSVRMDSKTITREPGNHRTIGSRTLPPDKPVPSGSVVPAQNIDGLTVLPLSDGAVRVDGRVLTISTTLTLGSGYSITRVALTTNNAGQTVLLGDSIKSTSSTSRLGGDLSRSVRVPPSSTTRHAVAPSHGKPSMPWATTRATSSASRNIQLPLSTIFIAIFGLNLIAC